MKYLHVVAFVLLVVGGLNWGLIGLMNYNLVDSIFGAGSSVSMVVYVLVGVSAVYLALTHGKDCKAHHGK